MNKSLSITIDNIPGFLWDQSWKDAIEEAKKDFGVTIEPSEKIKIDWSILVERDIGGFASLMASAQCIALVQSLNKYFNQQPK